MAEATTNQSTAKSNSEMPGAFQLFKPSWAAIRLNIITLIEFVVIPIIVWLLGALVFGTSTSIGAYGATSTSISTGAIVMYLIAAVLWMVFAPGITYTLIQSARGKTVEFTEALKTGLKFFWKYLALSIVLTVVIGIGFILLIVPGLFMLKMFMLSPYYLVDRNLGVFEAMSACSKECGKFSSAVWGIIGVEVLIGIINVIPFIGWIVSAIMGIAYGAAPAIRYNQITKAVKA